MNNHEIQTLYETYGHMILGRCRRILGSEDDAADAMQSVFLKLLQNIGTIRDRTRIVPWIFSAATNHCFNELRSNRKFDRQTHTDSLQATDRSEERMSAREIISILMKTQDRATREAVYYTHVEELDQEEIRRITGLSPATTRRHLRRFEEHCAKMKKRTDYR